MSYERVSNVIDSYLATLKRPGIVSELKEVLYCFDDNQEKTIDFLLNFRSWSLRELKQAFRLAKIKLNNDLLI